MRLLTKDSSNITFANIVEQLQIPQGTSKWDRCKKFIKDVAVTVKTKTIEFFKGLYQHAESITILTLSSFGLSALIGELPFWLTLPWWVEAPLVIPVVAVMCVYGLVSNGERRAKKRLTYA